MEQSKLDNISEQDSNIDIIKSMLVTEIHDPNYLKYLVVNQNANKIIVIKASSKLVCNIKLGKKVSFISFPREKKKHFNNCDISDANGDYSRILIDDIYDVKKYTMPISILFVEELLKLGNEGFGCCHRYVECSDALRCIHPNLLFSLGCAYKRNLESRRIFYGINRTT